MDRESIASASKILKYLRDTITENDLEPHIRYRHRVAGAHWSSETARWTVEIENPDTGARFELHARWLFSAAGYYRYDEGFTPPFEGCERFEGTIVHPQRWPEDLEYAGKRVVVVGSGATAVTLVPAMAEIAEHVTMVQRTPSYVIPIPQVDHIANLLRGYSAKSAGMRSRGARTSLSSV